MVDYKKGNNMKKNIKKNNKIDIAKSVYHGIVLGMLAGVLYLTLRMSVVVLPYEKPTSVKETGCDTGITYDYTEDGALRETYIPALDTCSKGDK